MGLKLYPLSIVWCVFLNSYPVEILDYDSLLKEVQKKLKDNHEVWYRFERIQ